MSGDERSTPDRIALWSAVALHGVIAVFPLAASGLLAPAWFVVVILLVWAASGLVLRRLAELAPRRAWIVPVTVLALWFVAVSLGERFLGWTA